MTVLPAINDLAGDTATRLSHWAPDNATSAHLQRLKCA